MEPNMISRWGPFEECPAGSWLGIKQAERKDSRPRQSGKGRPLLFSPFNKQKQERKTQ